MTGNIQAAAVLELTGPQAHGYNSGKLRRMLRLDQNASSNEHFVDHKRLQCSLCREQSVSL